VMIQARLFILRVETASARDPGEGVTCVEDIFVPNSWGEWGCGRN
jgi:hypothetical protein